MLFYYLFSRTFPSLEKGRLCSARSARFVRNIMKGNLELIVGLVLTLILKYQISLDDDDDNIKEITPKQALLAWCKMKILRTFPMNNFNKDWNDGRAIVCLVDAVAPGLFPECEKLDPSEALKNARQSMKTAEKWLVIPQVGSFYSIIIIIIMENLFVFLNVQL